MSLLKTLLNSYDVLGIDFRRGNFYPKKKGTYTKAGTTILIKGGARLTSSNYYNFSTYAIGLNDFTCIVRNSEIIGAGTTTPLTSSGGKLRLTLDGANYDSSVAFSSLAKTFAVSVDRSGTAKFYQDGVVLSTAVDISAKVAVDIATAVYSIQDFDSRLSSEYAFLIVGYAATATEISTLTDELNKMPDQRVSSKAIADGSGDKEILFKGELGVLSNETTTASGYLENSGAQILSGSCKMVTEKNNSKIEKVIVGVTDGAIYLPQAAAALTGWSMYVDPGTGTYAQVTTDLATARTIQILAG